ncbi:MAG TPA: VOC family protein [Pyrinomonadaceae bacterium]|jgi:PhnB protein
MARINPYLHFNDNAEEAFNFYKSVFGGEFAAVMRYGDGPGCDEMRLSDADKAKIMHIALPVGNDYVLMASDSIEASGQTHTEGNNFSISVSADSRDDAERVFRGLADGGKETMPLQDTFWGAYFGMLQDRYGVNWMVNYDERYAK